MKYLKKFEQNITRQFLFFQHIEDLFADLKEVFEISFNEHDEFSNILIRYNIPSINIDSTKKNIDELIKIKEYSQSNRTNNKFEFLYLELSKILKLCNCEYYLNGGENVISITFWIKK